MGVSLVWSALHTLGRLLHVLSKDGFLRYLCSKDGNIFNPDCLPVYQDMTQPLNHYFINSSHNTYLLRDQLCGQSSVEGYIRYSGSITRWTICGELRGYQGRRQRELRDLSSLGT